MLLFDLREIISSDLLLKICVVLIVGILGGKVARLLKLPNVSGYLLFGVLIGPLLLGLINNDPNDVFTKLSDLVSELALSAIAFSIGSEFAWKEMKKVGKAITIMTLAEVVGAVFVVFSVMYFLLNQTLAFSLVVASMSAATAPAATLLVIRQYRAYGPLTKTVLPIVALDDVFGIMCFGIAISIARISATGESVSPLQMIGAPLIEIIGSVLLGLIIGAVLSYVSKKAEDGDETQAITLAAIGLSTGLANILGFSSLLTNIVVGTFLVNVAKHSQRVFSSVNGFINPFFILFFTLAGASLDVKILAQMGLIGFLYLFARAGGKFIGAYISAKAVKAEKTVQKYLGYALFPQGGISIGLSVIVKQQLPADLAIKITTIIMCGVLFFEISGPIFAKFAISKANEINGLDRLAEVE